jgi:hypothetical protein
MEQRVLYIEVEYENKTSNPIQYRHDQWIVFDTEGHTFEPPKDFTHTCMSTEESTWVGRACPTLACASGAGLLSWYHNWYPSKTSSFQPAHRSKHLSSESQNNLSQIGNGPIPNAG